MKIRIDDLDMTLQTRCGTDADTVANYAEAMAGGVQFPDVTVFTDGRRHWLADGFHRVLAAKANGRDVVSADVRKGTEDDAVMFGGTANNRQGKRPTRADVQHFLAMVWERRESIFGGTPTGGNFAERCGVSSRTGQDFVRARLAEMRLPAMPSRRQVAEVAEMPRRLVGADGKGYPVRGPEPVRGDGSGGEEEWPRDRYGVQIPQALLGAFAEDTARDRLEAELRRALRAMREVVEGRDVSALRLDNRVLMDLERVVSAVRYAKPHCVCRMCQGQGCRACREAGYQTKMQYDANPPEFRAD